MRRIVIRGIAVLVALGAVAVSTGIASRPLDVVETALAGSASAAEHVSVAVDRTPVEIVASAGTDLTGAFTVTVSADADLFLTATDLRRLGPDPYGSYAAPEPGARCSEPPPTCVDASRITVDTSAPSIPAGIRTRIGVEVAAIAEPGQYRGWLLVQVRPKPPTIQTDDGGPLPTEEPFDSEAIELVVRVWEAVALPALSGQEKIIARRTLLVGPFDVVLGAILLPTVETNARIVVPFTNPGADSIRVLGIETVAIGQRTGSLLWNGLAPARLPSGLDGVVPATVQTPFAMTLDLERIRSDRYVGAVYVSTAGRSEPFVLPVDITVRAGPTWPLVLLALGLAFGTLAKWLTEHGSRFTAVDDSIRSTRARLTSGPSPGNMAALQPHLTRAESELRTGALDAASKRVTQVNEAIDLLTDLDALTARYPSADPEKVKVIRDRAALLNVKAGRTAFDELQDALVSVPMAPTPIPAPPAGGPESIPRPLPLRAPPRRSFAFVPGLVAILVVVVIAAIGVPLLSFGPEATPSPTAIATPSTQPTSVPPTLPPATLLPGGPPAAERVPVDDARTVALAVLGLLLAGVVGLLPVVSGRLPDHRVRLIRVARVVVSVGTPILLVLVGLRVLYVDDGASLLAAQIDPVLQFLLWGFAGGIGSKTLANVVK